MNKKAHNVCQSGFTLVELLVAIAIVGIVAASITRLFLSSNEIYSSQEQIVRLQQDIRATLDMMARNLRMAGLDPTNAGCAGFFEPTNSTAVHFRMDFDSDEQCSDANPEQDLLYVFLSGSNEIVEDSDRIARNIVSLDLCYWLKDASSCIADPGINDFNDIRRIDIAICGRISGPYSGKYNSNICFNSTVQCRNMGL